MNWAMPYVMPLSSTERRASSSWDCASSSASRTSTSRRRDGVHYAEALCDAGASVVVADVNADAAARAAAELTGKGYAVVGTAVDVRSADSARAMAQVAVDAFGGIDILVNNAAIMTDLPPYGLSNMPVGEWDRVMNVNLRGPLLCTQAVLESMTVRGAGRIVNGLSAGAFMAGGLYGISKYA